MTTTHKHNDEPTIELIDLIDVETLEPIAMLIDTSSSYSFDEAWLKIDAKHLADLAEMQ